MKLPSSNSSSRRSWLEIHLAVLLFGLASLFADWVQLPAIWIVLGRTGFAALFLALWLPVQRQRLRPSRRADHPWLLTTGLLLAFHWVAFFRAIQLSNVALGLLTFSSFPVFTVLLEPLFGQGQITRNNLLIAALTLAGVAILLPPLDWQLSDTRGAVWGLLAGFSFALLALVNRRLVAYNPGQRIAFWQDLVAFGVLLPLCVSQPAQPTGTDLGLLLLLGIVFTGVSHSLFIRGLRHVPARTASVLASLEPVYGILAAFLLLGQVPQARTLLGGGVILAATFLASYRPWRSQTQADSSD